MLAIDFFLISYYYREIVLGIFLVVFDWLEDPFIDLNFIPWLCFRYAGYWFSFVAIEEEEAEEENIKL